MNASDDSRGASSSEEIGREWAHGQRELLLPKSIQRTATDEKRISVARRPPVSYKPPVNSNASGGTTSIPPIRSFRSSGERRSLVLDMNLRSRNYEGSEEYGDANHRDRTLRALEGRRFDDASQITPPDSAGDRPDGDDNGDLFLKIAREDPSRRGADGNENYRENQGALVSQFFISRDVSERYLCSIVRLCGYRLLNLTLPGWGVSCKSGQYYPPFESSVFVYFERTALIVI